MNEEEALAILKKYYQEGNLDKVISDGDNFIFGDVKIPKNLQIDKFGGKYEFRSYYHMVKWSRPDKKTIEYFKISKEEDIPLIYSIGVVWEYFTSKTDTTPTDTAIPGISTGVTIPSKRTRENDSGPATPTKKVQFELFQPIELNDELKISKDAFIQMIESKTKSNEDSSDNQVKQKLYIEATKDLTQSIINREKTFQNRNTILQSSNKQFQSIIDSVKEHIRNEKLEEQRKKEEKKKYDRYDSTNYEATDHQFTDLNIDPTGSFSKNFASSSMLNNNNNSNSSSSKDKRNRSRPKEAIPIIIIPSAVTSLLSLQNFKDFAEKGILNASEKLNLTNKPTSVVVARKDPTTNHHKYYNVIDNPTKLKDSDWDKIIAVFALGAEWQFKNWKWSTPVDVFSRAKGFFLTYDDTIIPDKIASWDVVVLKVNRHQSHTVKQAQLKFWDLLDKSTDKKLQKSSR